ncbi:FAD-binding oxidoreductase [Agrobacterium sp. BT-220-3]|nr:FAD-binding oxidoreductase [Agrobacterium sp. BT-220-3]
MSGGQEHAEVAIIGAGIVGISVAYYLVEKYGVKRVVIIDPRDPMSLTSAQSGENYRNWWPDAVMRKFTDDSIDLMDRIARDSGNMINMTRRGYALITRRERPDDLMGELEESYRDNPGRLRVYEGGAPQSSYKESSSDWAGAPAGVDVVCDQAMIQRVFPTLAKDVHTVLHVRRAGSISGQQLGQYMLERIRNKGGRILRGELMSIDNREPFWLNVKMAGEHVRVVADRLVNAAGPFVRDVAAMLGEDLPVECVYQQKISFEDRQRVVPRDLPFTIDLDPQTLAWTDEEMDLLRENPATARFTEQMIGGIHCRPDGAVDGAWIKLGWAYNKTATDPHAPEPIDPEFPDIVLRGASRLQPGLARYVGRLPRNAHHYGGYYTMTKENWPLIGPSGTPGAFVAGALSGFGTMAACMTGSICADWVMGGPLVPYAKALSADRYSDPSLAGDILAGSRGLL